MTRYLFSGSLGLGLLVVCLALLGLTPWAAAHGPAGGALPPALATRPATPIPTHVPGGSPSPTPILPASVTAGLPTPLPTRVPPCGAGFTDVHTADYYYASVQYLACRTVVSGYTCGGPGEPCDPQHAPYFRPGANTTRGQLTKMVTAGMGWTVRLPATPTFADVPPGQPFYPFVETAAAHGVISGYTCGGPGEPCDPARRPYFRPYASVTRGQLSKVIVGAKGWQPATPPLATFADVPAGSPFFAVVETAVTHGLISGYTCGGPGEPCDAQNRPYFRSGHNASRGQLSKILYLGLIQP